MTTRIPQVNQLIKRQVSDILLRRVGVIEGAVVTLTRVESSGNLQQAKLYISVIPEAKTNEVFRFLSQNIYEIQQELNKRLRMRPVPKIIWVKEEMTEEAEKIETLLDKIKKDTAR